MTTAWREWQDSPWGRLRYALALANLRRHLPPWARILDVGGGDGSDAVALTSLGHDVTVVDNSPSMLEIARSRGLECVEASVWEMPDLGSFDVVLCHNLVQYEPECLPAVVAPLRPGGLVSVMAINRHSAPLVTAIRALDLAGAVAALDSPVARTATFDREIRLFTYDEIVTELRGCEVLGHYGIRSVCDYIADDSLKHSAYEALEELELALTDREPYMHTARLFQVIAQVDS
ncbi:class I SAM-dependent methyltransferase [Lentzea sp. NPDC051213]|uniref:class I SAM-dependent methyltransferase n=1 Tax=Lentzea sp. NPDC051213 TaxID=3364126 RepID=UPI0037A24C8D